jgi:hypothetical protein
MWLSCEHNGDGYETRNLAWWIQSHN